jgi:hypothetical protein
MNVFKSLVSMSVLSATVAASMFTQVNIQANSTIPSFKVGMQSASAANFEDYFQDGNVVSLYNNGQAVNLHFLNKGGMINSHNPNGGDDDQKFLVIRKPGTNQVQLQRVGTNFIITPKEYGHLVPLEAWLRSATIPFHSMQTWYVDMVPNSDKVWFRPVGGVPYAMNLPLGQFNRKLTTARFDANDPDQKFGVQVWSRRNVPPVKPQAQVVQPPVVQPIVQQPTPRPVVVTQVKKVCPAYNAEWYSTYSKYEAVIAAVKPIKVNLPGHAIFGLVRTKVTQISNGNCGQEKLTEVFYKTISAEGPDKFPVTVLTATKVNNTDSAISTITNPGYEWDMHVLRKYYNEGVPKYTGGWVYLRKEIDVNKYNTLTNYEVYDLQKLTGCFKYNWSPKFKAKDRNLCHCGDVSARMYGEATGNWEFNNDTTPRNLYNLINKY